MTFVHQPKMASQRQRSSASGTPWSIEDLRKSPTDARGSSVPDPQESTSELLRLPPRFSWSSSQRQSAMASALQQQMLGFQPQQARGVLSRSLSARPQLTDTFTDARSGTLTAPTGASPTQLQPQSTSTATAQQALARKNSAPVPQTSPRSTGWSLDAIKGQLGQLQSLCDTLTGMSERPMSSRPSQAGTPRLSASGTADMSQVGSRVNADISAVLAAVLGPKGSGPADAGTARAALLQLYVDRCSQALELMLGGRGSKQGVSYRQSSDGSKMASPVSETGSITGQTEVDRLPKAMQQLQQLLLSSGKASYTAMLAYHQDVAKVKAELGVLQEDNTLLRNTLAQAKAQIQETGAGGMATKHAAEMAALQSSVLQLTQQVTTLTQQLDQARTAAAAAAAESRELQRRAESAEASCERSQRDVTALCTEVASWQNRHRTLQAQLTDLKARNEELVSAASRDSHGQQLCTLQDTNQALKADLQALQEASTASTVEVQRLTLQLSDQTSLTSALQSALDEAKAQTAEMQAQLQSTMSVSDKHKDIVSTLEGRLQNLQEDKQRLQLDRDSLSEELQRSQLQLSRAMSDCHRAHSDMEERDMRVRQLQIEVRELKKAHETATQSEQAAKQRATAADASSSAARQALSVAEQRWSQAHQKLAQAEERLAKAEQRASETQTECERLKGVYVRVCELESEIVCLRERCEMYEGRVRECERELRVAEEAAAHTQTQLAQALKRAEDSEAEGVRQRDALDAEWAALAAARAALQEDSQTVRAMGTLVQAGTLRFDIQSLTSPASGMPPSLMPPMHSATRGSMGGVAATGNVSRPMSAASGDPQQARLVGMIRELQAQLQATQVRATQREQAALTAQQATQSANDTCTKLSAQLSKALQALEAKEGERTSLEQTNTSMKTQLDTAMSELQASQAELREARRLLDSSSRAGLTTEARVVLEAQLVNAKRAADEKSRLAAALGDQVVALREELRRVQSTNASNQQLPSTTQPTSTGIQQLHNTTQFTNASTQQLPSTTQPAALKSNPSAPSDAQRQTKAISPPVKIAHTTEDAAAGSARQESTHSTRQPACEVSPASQQPAAAAADTLQPIGPRPSCSASTQQPLACDQATQGGQVAEECEGSDNSRQLEGVVAMLTAQLQDAEQTICRQDSLIAKLQAKAHSNTQQPSNHPSPSATEPDSTKPSTPASSSAGHVRSSNSAPTSSDGRLHTGSSSAHGHMQQHAGHAAGYGALPRRPQSAMVPKAMAGGAIMVTQQGPQVQSHAPHRPRSAMLPIGAGTMQQDRYNHVGQLGASPGTAAAAAADPARPSISSSTANMTANSVGQTEPLPRPHSALQQDDNRSASSANHAAVLKIPRPHSAIPAGSAARSGVAAATAAGALTAAGGAPRMLSASEAVRAARPMSAVPAQRQTMLLLSSAEPSAQAGLPSLAQATADAQRFMSAWNARYSSSFVPWQPECRSLGLY